MNYLKSYRLATVVVASLVASLAFNIVRAKDPEGWTVTSSTGHFKSGKTYRLTPANGAGVISCKVTDVDGAWLKCEASNEWVNTNAVIYAHDSQ